MARLEQLHCRHKHALILGALGVGKTALVDQLKGKLSLLVSAESEHLVQIFDCLEAQLKMPSSSLKIPQRKRRLLHALTEAQQTVVFDGVKWITPKLSSFLTCVMERAPMWICSRSEHPWDIGHFWTWLVRLETVRLQEFRPAETREFVTAAVEAGQIPVVAKDIVEWMHRRSSGSPLVLRELCEELATNRYDLTNPHALRRLDLDRRIHEVFPAGWAGEKGGKSPR
jgi:hypothetical protein